MKLHVIIQISDETEITGVENSEWGRQKREEINEEDCNIVISEQKCLYILELFNPLG